MFVESSDIYDLIYSFKDYEKESMEIKNLLNKLSPACDTILDVACGTGEHHKYLKENYKVDGLDLNQVLLNGAKPKNPNGNYFAEDMTDFNLNKKYDVILCLFSSIGYVKTYDKIVSTFNSFNKHLNAGGLIIVEPWFTPDSFDAGRIDLLTFEKGDYTICRMNDTNVSGRLSTIKFHFLVGKKNEEVSYFDELHELGLFTVEDMNDAFTAANFNVDYNTKGLMGRGLYYGRKL